MNNNIKIRNLVKNKKAEAGETLTWVVVTVVIIVILALSIYAADLLGNGKRVQRFGKDLGEGLITISTDSKTRDLLSAKSVGAFLLTDVNGAKAYDRLKVLENFDEPTGKLARIIFCEVIYKKGCDVGPERKINFWMGFITKPVQSTLESGWKSNDYFGGYPISEDTLTSSGNPTNIQFTNEDYFLTQNKYIRSRMDVLRN